MDWTSQRKGRNQVEKRKIKFQLNGRAIISYK
jgi:hypothetical protein